MGIADGTPLGRTVLVDHGPDALRWNLVIVAEGYQSTEQDTFNTDADNFVKFLLDQSPFDAIDVESGINISRVNIASNESGADDPAACGGSGVQRNTYLDATYCGDGKISRDLVVDNLLAKQVVTSLGGTPTCLLVLVNDTGDGGTGNVGIAVTSKSPDWLDTTLHEIGHAAFLLADEYAYVDSPVAQEPGQAIFPGPEPPAANATMSLNPLK
jgi:IgA Peptidase M64